MRQWLSTLRIAVPALLAAALCAPALVLAAAVGEVTFAAGDARIEGVSAKLARGAQVEVGQTIVTGAGGHVHVRFVDDAFVAVRPNSQLSVDDYAWDPDNAAANRVKFTLRSGTGRLITGKAGQANKQGFRLNTPMAAIGVRGTDFVVRASADTTRVSVQQGAVVMAPYGSGCSADALGACGGTLARQLTASLAGTYLEQRGQEAPRLVRVEPAKLPDLFAPARSEEPAPGKAAANGEAPGSGGAQAGAPPGAATATATTGSAVPAAGTAATAAGLTAPVSAAPRMPPDGFTGSANIFGGRWDRGGGNAAILNSASYQVIAEQDGFVLVRPTDSTRQPLPDRGQVSFRLVQSVGFINSGQGFTEALIESPRLSVNFGRQTYDTALTVNGGGSRDSIRSHGSISDDGRFAADPARSNADISGGLSNGGQEAGYVFLKPDGSGSFSSIGVTRWER
jgi:hypothetical protein